MDNKISELSYQRFARFFGELQPSDPNFTRKMNVIYKSIAEEGNYDIILIAKEAGCSFDECVMKIKYLENKRFFENLHIDTLSGKIKKCTLEDETLLKKYSTFIYNNHYQIKEMAVRLPGATMDKMPELEEKVFKDIEYLDSKGLINGIYLDKENRTITYYTIEKHKDSLEKITINCPYCGAINDVYKNGKSTCVYCKSVIEAKTE